MHSVLWTYGRAGQAEEAQSILAEHGITCELRDENINRTQSSGAISITILVPDADIARASDLLREAQRDVFGSVETASRLQSDLVRWVGVYAVYSLGTAVISFFVVARRGTLVGRCEAALMIGALCGFGLALLHSKWKRRNG